ncbi:MAG: dTMP kinase [Clostridia bacterium]|nr:dTMP kinase [Clostridia bacterium]
MEKGKLIVLEGIDGSGKSSHVALLAERLDKEGYKAARTAEPTDGAIGTLLRRYLKGELAASERTIAALFLADRLDHIQKAGGLLDMVREGYVVVCDRYLYSSIAYNCASEGVDWVSDVNRAAHDLLKPDLVVYLNLPLAVMEQRLQHRNFKEIYETVAYQRKVLERYEEAFSVWADDVVVKVDCNRPKADVAEDVWRAVRSIL